MKSGLYAGHVMHQRLRPRRHRLAYRLFMLLLDLDGISGLDGRLRLFSRNRRNLVSFHDCDHGDGSETSLKAQVERHLADAGFATGGPILLLAMPRLLGFVFNPISVYYCHDRAGRLSATLYEVTNTFGQRHSYLLPAHGSGTIRQHVAKNLYVSPFLGMDMDYDFRLKPPGAEAMLAITASDDKGAKLVAAMKLGRRDLTDAALLKSVATHPLMTLKVVAGIHWEALKLWLKRVPLVRRPAPPEKSISGPKRNPLGKAA